MLCWSAEHLIMFLKLWKCYEKYAVVFKGKNASKCLKHLTGVLKNSLEIHSMKFEHILILLQVLHVIVRIHDCGSKYFSYARYYLSIFNIFRTSCLSVPPRFWRIQKDSMENGSSQRSDPSFPDVTSCKIQHWRYSWQIEVQWA